MKSRFYKQLLLSLLLSAPLWSMAEEVEKLPAFPGAEGFGRYVTGGRGGAVYHVTNLEDSGEGSLRWALSQKGVKTIVFDVSGTIHLQSPLSVSIGNVTLAGQTAPGDGICVADYPFTINASNVIIRFMRFRLGNKFVAYHEGDGLGGMDQKDIMVDHCSTSWSVDECLSVYGCKNMTVQWCIVSQSMYNAGHSKGNHGYGGNWGGSGASYHHNLIAHHSSRTPRLGPRYTTQLDERMDMRNNVIYNWGGNGCYGGEAMTVNIVNNYYKPGPATLKRNTSIQQRIAGIGIRTTEYVTNYPSYAPTKHVWGDFYVEGNVNTLHSNVTADNWTYGIYNQITSSNNDGLYNQTVRDTMRLAEPMDFVYVTTHDAATAYDKVLLYAGASLSRDAVDSLMVYDTQYGKASHTGVGLYNTLPGIINSQDDNRPSNAPDDWSAWPTLNSLPSPTDSDGDGMPDEWERAHGLDPSDASDGNKTNDEGYTMLEVYMNSLVDHIMQGGMADGIPQGYTLIDESVGKGTAVTLSASTCIDGDWGFVGGYSIATSKGYSTGKEDGVKYSRNQVYTINLPNDIEVTAMDFTGYCNYADADGYIAQLGSTTYGSSQYVFPRKDAEGNYTVASHSVTLPSPVKGTLPFKFAGQQVVMSMTLWTRSTATGVEAMIQLPIQDYVDVYTVGHQLVRRGVYYKHALQGLPTGIYIVGGQKVFWNNR